MATILAATSLDLTRAQKKEFLDEIGKSVGEVFRFYSIYYMPVNPEYCSECAVDQITYFVFVPPYMELDRRRALIKKLDDTTVRVVGYKGELKVIVIFKYHDDEACGVDGVLRADAKAAEQNAK